MTVHLPDHWVSLSSHYRRRPFKPYVAVTSRSDGHRGTWFRFSVDGIRSMLEYRSLAEAIAAAESVLAEHAVQPQHTGSRQRRPPARRRCPATLPLPFPD